jgi:hypothetical protein
VRAASSLSSRLFDQITVQHGQRDSLEGICHQACKSVDEDIDMYSGLKHSSCSQYINEKHYSLDQVQMMTDHARRESVKRYASVQVEEENHTMFTSKK